MNEILEKVIKLVEETLDVEDVTAETLMQDDLGIESLEFYELFLKPLPIVSQKN